MSSLRSCRLSLFTALVGALAGCTADVPTGSNSPGTLPEDGAATVTASTQTSWFSISPLGCGVSCFGVDVPEGTNSAWNVTLNTSDGQPLGVAKTFRIFTSNYDPFITQPVCTHGAGTAVAGADYTALDVTVNVPAGTAHNTQYPTGGGTYNVPTTDDSSTQGRESNERFVIQLNTVANWECAAIIEP